MKVEMKGLEVCGHCQKWQTPSIATVPFMGRCSLTGEHTHCDSTCPSWAFEIATAPYDEGQIKKIRRSVEDLLRKGPAAQVVETAIKLGVVTDL
jgi:hypothetical protein